MALSQASPIIAITGGMGSGKSAVAAALCEASGAREVCADAVCRRLLEPGAEGWQGLRREYGDTFIGVDGKIDRPKLRGVLFTNEEVRIRVNGILHPLVRVGIAEAIAEAAVSSARFVVEVPLLYEVGWGQDFSRVVVVYADLPQCARRIVLRDQVSEAEARYALKTQWPMFDKALLAGHVVDNSGAWPDTLLQVLHLRDLLWSD